VPHCLLCLPFLGQLYVRGLPRASSSVASTPSAADASASCLAANRSSSDILSPAENGQSVAAENGSNIPSSELDCAYAVQPNVNDTCIPSQNIQIPALVHRSELSSAASGGASKPSTCVLKESVVTPGN
jgi:hypothetical protein